MKNIGEYYFVVCKTCKSFVLVGKLREYDDHKGKLIFRFFRNHVRHHIEVIGDNVHVDHDFAKVEDNELIVDPEYTRER